MLLLSWKPAGAEDFSAESQDFLGTKGKKSFEEWLKGIIFGPVRIKREGLYTCLWGDSVSRLQGSSMFESWSPRVSQPWLPLPFTLGLSPHRCLITLTASSISSDVLDIPPQVLSTAAPSGWSSPLPSPPSLGWSLLIPLVLTSVIFFVTSSLDKPLTGSHRSPCASLPSRDWFTAKRASVCVEYFNLKYHQTVPWNLGLGVFGLYHLP